MIIVIFCYMGAVHNINDVMLKGGGGGGGRGVWLCMTNNVEGFMKKHDKVWV